MTFEHSNERKFIICRGYVWNNTISHYYFQIILKLFQCFYFTCRPNNVWNWNKIISAAERVLKLFQNYFSNSGHIGKYSRAAISLWNNFEIPSGKFPCAEIKLFQTDVDEGGNNYFEIILFYMIVTTALVTLAWPSLVPWPWHWPNDLDTRDVDILKMCVLDKNEVSRSRLLKVRAQTGQTDRETDRQTRPNALPSLTLAVPYFFWLWQNESTEAFSAILVLSNPLFLIFWHSGTLALSPERQSARMSKY